MNKKFILIILFVFLSGCIDSNRTTPAGTGTSLPERPGITNNSGINNQTINQTGYTPVPAGGSILQTGTNQTGSITNQSDLLIDRIALNLSTFYDKKWFNLYQADELDCSRMSTYLWSYLRTNYHVAPKIIISYQRQHAWLALKVSDVGNSSKYRHWNINGIDYYYVEATIPKIVTDDNQKFLINGQPYTSAEFYDATINVFDSPSDANDFHADYSALGGFNQEFVLKKNDLDKIQQFLK
jgi:hypothetical protein